MKKNILLFYILSTALVFVSIMAWEFLLEDIIQSLVNPGFLPETVAAHWEYVQTVFIFCAVALVIPTLLAWKIENKRQAALDSLDKLQKKTADLLGEKTIELVSARQKLDDTEYKQATAQEKNDKTNISMQALIDSISDCIMVIDRNYRVRMFNKTAKSLYSSAALLSDPLLCHKLSHNEDTPCAGPEHECPFALAMESGKSCTVLHYHLDAHGNKIPFEIQASPILNDSGDVLGIIELSRDVSERLAREKKQKEADTLLLNLQRDQSIATLAGGLAHEFNNILTSILGNAELLSIRLSETDINKKQTGSIIAGCEHMAHLTRQLLSYAKGGKYLDQSILINALIKDALHLMHTDKFTDTVIEVDLDYDLWPVSGDPTQISQLILNIIMNGFEALENTVGKLIIRTANLTKTERWECNANESRPPGDYVLISITNTGSTIPEELMKKIFEPFFSTKFTGRGMGLAAAKGIVQNHNGCISVESHTDQTSFQVFLPREISDTQLILGDGKSTNINLGLKILVVDDEPPVLSIIKNLLNQHGCNVLIADKGQEALAIIERLKNNLDLVILDIQMPDMGGDKVYTMLKKIKPGLKVLISSGHEEFTALKNVLLDPRDKFIKKPFRMSDLLLKIKEMTIKD